MRWVRSFVCVCAVLLATTTLAEGEDGSVGEPSSRIEKLLNSKLVERIRGYLNQGILENERVAQYIDRDYWNAIKDDFGVRVATAIAEDEFFQAMMPIIKNVQADMKELVQLTLQELTKHGENIATRVRAALAQLQEKAALLVEQAVVKVKQLIELMPEEYQAMIYKVGTAVGNTAQTAAEEVTAVAAIIVISPFLIAIAASGGRELLGCFGGCF